jgi:cobalamin synthase
MALCQQKIKGFTGDTVGALSELSEMVILVTLATIGY